MPRPIEWTADMDAKLRRMRAGGRPCAEISDALGISKNGIVNRLDRLGMATGARFRRLHQEPYVEQRDETPLPAGHPVSWGAISDHAWPADIAASRRVLC